MEPKVSVLTCSYNRRPYIEACADSLLKQNVGDWEWLIHDDGSTDGTYDYLASIKDPRIHVHQAAHRGYEGVIDAQNALLQSARGEWVAFLDSDDAWMPGRLEMQLEGLDDPSIVLNHGDVWLINSESEFKRVLKPHRSSEILRNQPVGRATVYALEYLNFPAFAQSSMVRRSSLLKVGGFIPGAALWDFSTFLELSLLGSFRYVPRPVACWRRHTGQETMTAQTNLKNYRAHYEKAREFLAAHGDRLASLGFPTPSLAIRQRAFFEKAERMEALIRALNFLDIENWPAAKTLYTVYLKEHSFGFFSKQLRLLALCLLGLLSSAVHVNIVRRLFDLKMRWA